MAFDPYYSRPEVSNSDLTALKYKLFPQLNFVSENAKLEAFRKGTLVDALITEPKAFNYYKKSVGDYTYTDDEIKWGMEMRKALIKYSQGSKAEQQFMAYVLKYAETQKAFVNPAMKFDVGFMQFELPTRCKFDWWMPGLKAGLDLKTTSATNYKQFLDEVEFIGWHRSRAWYADLVNQLNPALGNTDGICAISKKNFKIFFLKMKRGDKYFENGRKEYTDLAFKMWCFR